MAIYPATLQGRDINGNAEYTVAIGAIAIGVGADPAIFALTVALATSNSFLLPTHQVNALIMGPGGYRVPDFMRAGIFMTIIFLAVMMIVMNLIY